MWWYTPAILAVDKRKERIRSFRHSDYIASETVSGKRKGREVREGNGKKRKGREKRKKPHRKHFPCSFHQRIDVIKQLNIYYSKDHVPQLLSNGALCNAFYLLFSLVLFSSRIMPLFSPPTSKDQYRQTQCKELTRQAREER